MTRVLPLPRLVGLVVLAVVMAVGAGAFLVVPDRTVDRLQIVVAPHPDDEFLAFPALDDAPGTFTVLVSLSRGENTGRCDDVDRYLQSEAGERPPEPRPESRQSIECAEARRNSWLAFLTDAGSLTREVRLGPGGESGPTSVSDTRFGGDAEVWRGRDGARMMLSLPDGQLTERGAEEALEGVLGLRGTALPDLPVERIILASYWLPAGDETSADSGFVYEHADHGAVTHAAPAIARHAGADVWVTAPRGFTADLDTADGQQVVRTRRALSEETYAEYLALEPAEDAPENGADQDRVARRTGVLQVNYGWLAFPEQAWGAGEVPDEESGVLFARVQDYLIVGAP